MTSPAIDGTPVEDHATWHGNGTGGVQIATGYTSVASNDLLVAVLGFNTSGPVGLATVTGVTSTSGLTWTKRSKKSEASTQHDSIEIWTAPVSGTVTTEKITVTTDKNVNAGIMVLFGVKQLASNVLPFDPNGSLTASNTATGTGNPAVTYSTTNADDLIIFAQCGDKSGAGTGILSGFTLITNVTNGSGAISFCGMSVLWKSVSATQTSVTTSGATGNGSANAVAVVDAFTADATSTTASGDLATITMSATAGTATLTANATGDLATITMSPPAGNVTPAIEADGAMRVINMTAPVGSGGVGVVGSGTLGTIQLTPPGTQIIFDTQYGLLVARDASVDAETTQFGAMMTAAPATIIRNTQLGLLVLASGGETPLVPDPLSLNDQGRDQVMYLRMVNMYAEPTPQGPGTSARFQRPGLYSVATRGGGPIRCSFLWNGFRFTVSGNSVWRDAVAIGVIPNDFKPIRFAFSDEEIVMVTGGFAYYITTTSVAQITDPDLFPNINDVKFLGGRFIYSDRDNAQFQWSELGDAQSIDGLSFATAAENTADKIIGMEIINDQLVFFLTESIEWWYTTADPDNPYQRSQGRRNDRGAAAQNAIVALDNSLMFIGENRIVYRAAAVPERVSDFSVEDKIRRVALADLPNITAVGIIYGGHTFYVINLPGQGSWALDVGQKLWAEWSSFNHPFFRAATCDKAGVIGDLYSGNLMGVDGGQYTDVGDSITRVVSTFLPLKTGYSRQFNIILDCTRGVGLPTGYGSDPVVEMRFSDDTGKSWTDWDAAPLGESGDTTKKALAMWVGLGNIVSPGRLFEFRCSDPVAFTPYQVRFNEQRP